MGHTVSMAIVIYTAGFQVSTAQLFKSWLSTGQAVSDCVDKGFEDVLQNTPTASSNRLHLVLVGTEVS